MVACELVSLIRRRSLADAHHVMHVCQTVAHDESQMMLDGAMTVIHAVAERNIAVRGLL